MQAMNQSTIPSGLQRWLIITTVMAATFMQALDMTIANVALPHMQAALGANPESVAWVLTSYIIMAAVTTPITGWLEARMGRRNLFAIAIAGFTASSAACGFAVSLEMMIASRAMQGIFGAFIVPLGQATMLDSSSMEKRPQAMMIFTMGITMAPILGPVLGGWLTDSYSWRWVFFINVPVGIVAVAGIWFLLDNADLPRRRFDLFGFALIALALASLQLMLDRGPQRDWFEATEVLIEAGLAIGASWMFVVHILTAESPVLPLGLLKDRNYLISMLFTMLVMGISLAGPALMATFLQVLLGYDTMGAGMMMMPRGVGALVAMPLATYLGRAIDPRALIALGLGLTGLSLWMMTGFNLQMGKDWLIYSALIQGLGMGLTFLPLTILAFSTLPAVLRTEGAAFYSLSRSVAGSIAISVMGALLAHNTQVNHEELGARVTAMHLPFPGGGVVGQLGAPGGAVVSIINAEVDRQAVMISFIDDFWLMMWAALICLPFVVFMGRAKAGDGPVVIVE